MNKIKSNKIMRFHTIDLIRGFCIISMVLYHFFYDLHYVFNVQLSWFQSHNTYLWQQSICITFIFIAGISFSFSKNNLKRGFLILFMGMVFSLVTYLIIPEQFIVFGILHFIGIACIITALLCPLLKKIPAVIGFFVFLLLFLITKEINNGYLGFGDIHLIKVSQKLYTVPFLSVVGFPTKTFFSADYFPIFPWIFLYISGFFSWFCISPKVKQAPIFKIKLGFINFLGRNSLIIYLLHQPILYGILYLFFKEIIGK